MGVKDREARVQKVLTICRGRWLAEGIPEDRADEMAGELEQHLRGSLADGQTVEDVVGDDVFGFAEEWAAPNRPRKPVGHEVLEMFAATSAFMSVAVLAAHLWRGSAILPVGWEMAGFFTILAVAFSMLFARIRRPAGEPGGGEKSVWDIYPLWLQAGIITFAILTVTYDYFLQSTEEVAFVWPWPATAALLAACPILLALKKVVRGRPPEARRASYDDPLYDEFDTEEEIGFIVEDAVFYWKTDTRIPADRAREMGEELGQHLRDAVADGKTVESVVSPDVEAFAESWADEERPPASTRDRVVEVVFGISAFFTFTAGLGHVFGWELHVPILWFPLLFFIGVASWLVRQAVGLTSQPQTGSLRKSWLLTAGVALLAVGLAVGLAFALFGVREAVPLLGSLRWPWYATLASAAVTLLTIPSWLKG